MEEKGRNPFEVLFEYFKQPKESISCSPLLITGSSGSGKTFFLENLSQLLVKQGETVFLSNIIDFLPKEILDPTHPDYTESDNQKPLLGLFQGCINHSPCWLLLDNLDLIAAKDESSESVQLLGDNAFSLPMENIRSIFLMLLDKSSSYGIHVIAATQDEKHLFSAFTRSGRFDRAMKIPVPSKIQRESILADSVRVLPIAWDNPTIQKTLKYDDSYSIERKQYKLCQYLAERTPGFVTRDLRNLLDNMKTQREDSTQSISWENIENALHFIQPSQKNYFESKFISDTENDDEIHTSVAGCHELQESIKMLIQLPLLYPQKFARFNLTRSSNGMLLFGPSGCGKTFATKILLRSLLGQSVNVIPVQGPRLFSKYVGDTELSIRSLFATARKLSPSVLIIDEIDAIGGKRSEDESGGVHERALSTLLNEIDGIEERQSVYIIGCTNRPDLLDAAIIRPGRLDRMVYMSKPNHQERYEMLELMERHMPLQLSKEEKEQIVSRTDSYSYADIKSLCREAALCSLRQNIEATIITKNHFAGAFMRHSATLLSAKLSNVYQTFSQQSNKP